MKVDMSVVVGLVGMMSLTVLIKDGRLLLVSGGLEMKHKEAYLDRMLTMVTTALHARYHVLVSQEILISAVLEVKVLYFVEF